MITDPAGEGHGPLDGFSDLRRAVPGVGNVISGAGNAISEARNVVPEARNAISEARNVVPEARNAISEARNVVPEARNVISEARNCVSEAGNRVRHAGGDAAHSLARPAGRFFWDAGGRGAGRERSSGHCGFDSEIARNERFTLALPFWMLAVVFGLWPLGFEGVRLLRKRTHAPNLCTQCGYDLRATPDPAGPRLPRCPECGRHRNATID